MKNILPILCLTLSFSAMADVCSSLQKAEANIVGIAYYNSKPAEARSFCYSISQAVNSQEGNNIGLDGLLVGSIEYCAQGKALNTKVLAKEVSTALKSIHDCHSLMGQ